MRILPLPNCSWLAIGRKTTGLILLIAFLLILQGNPTFAQSSSQSKFDWIRSARILLVDAYTYPLHPKIEFDAEKMAETMVDMHFNTVRIATSGFYWLIPGTKFDTAPNLGNRDILAECLAACKPRGIKVVAYLRTGGPVAPEVMRPEWAYRVNPEGDLYYKRHFGELMTPFCWNTSYRQAFLDLVEKVVSRYDIDGIYFDAWLLYYDYPYPKVCYCQGCKDGFKEATGLELPYRRNVNEYTAEELKTIDRYHDWCRAKLAEIFQETKRLIKSYKDIPLIFNLNSASNINNTSYTDPSIVEGCDAFLYENTKCMLERAEGVSLAVSHGLAVWPYVGAIDGYPRIVSNNYELAQQIYTTIVFGGAPILYQNYSYVDYPDERKPVKEAFYILEKNKSHIENFYPQKFCAVVWNKKDPPGHANKGWVWQTNARNCTTGAFAACIYNHIQTTSFLKEDLNNSELLNQYQVLYLPDICYLSDKQIANIKNFVRQGGGLIMTYATSLYDKEGRKRPDFALGEMARIQYLNPDKKMAAKIAANLSYGGAWDLYMKTRPGQQVIKPPLTDNLMPAFLYEPVKALSGGEVAADIVVGTNMEHIFPALVVSRYGKGKVAYIPAALDAAYLQSHIRQFGDFIKDVIEYVSPAGLPFEIEAPSSLIANMTSKGDTRVLHLVNWTGCKLERMQQNAYYIPPIDNVVIKYNIPQGKKIKKVALFVPGEFSQDRDGNTLYITLPKVGKYQAVIIELE